MFSIGMTYNLKPDCYAGYKKAHDELWPEVAGSMSDNGVNMIIFRHGDQLFLTATAPTEANWNMSREHPKLAEWIEFMTKFLVADDTGEIIFHEMEEAFVFGDFS